jgi:hypothetical protein
LSKPGGWFSLPTRIDTVDAPRREPSTIGAPSMGGGNAGTYSGVNYALADIIDSFSVYGPTCRAATRSRARWTRRPSSTWTTSPS